MAFPLSTYRFQFNHSFKFKDAEKLLSYIGDLGISTVYASPIFAAKKGSLHGYDIVNPGSLNDELGSRVDFELLTDSAERKNLSWVQDIVPNHMAFDSSNPLVFDLLENGPESLPLQYFDINWSHVYEPIRGRLIAPFLGDIYGECLERGEIKLEYDKNGFHVKYYDTIFPLRIESYAQILNQHLGQLKTTLGHSHSTLVKLLGVLYSLKNLPSAVENGERKGQVSFVKSLLWELYSTDNDIRSFLETNIVEFNGIPGKPASFNFLDGLLSQQVFKLCYWKVANEELDYRRFFAVNDLISVHVEDEKVFEDVHKLVFEFIAHKRFTGLRVDHIDGLYDPKVYLERLRKKAGDDYIVVEKILGYGEQLPEGWPIQGTTGYDFLNYLNNLYCKNENKKEFDRIYHQFTNTEMNYEKLIIEKKKLIIENHMGGDIDNLANLIQWVSRKDRRGTDMTLYGLRRSLVELLAYFPVYRSYINSDTISASDKESLENAMRGAQHSNPALSREINFIGRYLLLQWEPYTTEEERKEWIHAVMKFQQYTGPLMAKGFEDTTLYIYNRLISLNEVGGWPGVFGIDVSVFHEYNKIKSSKWPYSMNATATHDTKRGEDARARINVLSEIPDEWQSRIAKWVEINKRILRSENGSPVPDANDQYFFYQSLVGAYPFSKDEHDDFVNRIKEYMLKSIREAKIHTEWIRPDSEYEKGVTEFVTECLDKDKNREFFDDFLPFVKRVSLCGILNSLSQTLLKCVCPGIPDFYQGSDLWDFSFVDPDNRRPVDYERRISSLYDIMGIVENGDIKEVKELLENYSDGKVKMFLIYQTLSARKKNPELFLKGAYNPIEVAGYLENNIIAFSRTHNDKKAIVVAPRFFAKITENGVLHGSGIWGNTSILLPGDLQGEFKDAVTGRVFVVNNSEVRVAELFADFPGALLVSK